MVTITFESIKFIDNNDYVRANFLKIFYFEIPKKEIMRVGEFKIENGSIIFTDDNERRINRRFQRIIDRHIDLLRSTITKKPVTYIHKNSGIPLIGTNSFGIVDRSTNVIEIKPLNGCNIDCIYCSVDENKRTHDFVVEDEYLSEEFEKIVKYKNVDNIEAHIAGQCEPTLYAPLDHLIKRISSNPQVKTISIDTNGMPLTKKRVDELISAGLTRINLSVNSLDSKNAKKIANGHYDVEHIKELIPHIADRIDLIIAPVLLKGINESDIEEIIKFVKSLKTKKLIHIGIQNFLSYRFGKKPVKEMAYKNFFDILKAWEKKYDVNLTKLPIEFTKTKPLPKPFKKGQTIEANIRLNSRFHEEKIAIAEERLITIPNCKKSGKVRIKLTRDKDNIFFGQL